MTAGSAAEAPLVALSSGLDCRAHGELGQGLLRGLLRREEDWL